MKRQPGFISTQPHRAIAAGPTYLNCELIAAFRAEFAHPEFAASLSAYPSSAIATPHIFQKVAGPRACVASRSGHWHAVNFTLWRGVWPRRAESFGGKEERLEARGCPESERRV
jgi:hypothetical protein